MQNLIPWQRTRVQRRITERRTEPRTGRSLGFFSYSLSDKTNGLPLPHMTANCSHKALYNHYCDYSTFRRHLSCVWSPSRRRGGTILFFILLIKLVSLCRAPALFIIAVWDRCESLRARVRPCVSSSVGVSSVHNKVAIPNSLLGLPRGTRLLSRDLFTAQF